MANALWRYTRDPRPCYVAGVLLIAGSAVAAAVTWPPSWACLRPFVVGVGLVLRGVVLHLVRRYRRRIRTSGRDGGVRSPTRAGQLVLGRGSGSSAGTRPR